MRFNASFLELALAYGLSAYVFGEVCAFGCTWHNLPASALAFAGAVYCGGRALECVAAWLTGLWRKSFGKASVQWAGFARWDQGESRSAQALTQAALGRAAGVEPGPRPQAAAETGRTWRVFSSRRAIANGSALPQVEPA